MRRIPPTWKIGKKAEDLVNYSLEGEGDVNSLIFRLSVERLVQEPLAQEQPTV
jgi:hypothetical protein